MSINVTLTEDEIAYVDRALSVGVVQSTEILWVLMLGRMMRTEKLMTPMEIQTLLTEMKGNIQIVWRTGKSNITGDYIPAEHREKKE